MDERIDEREGWPDPECIECEHCGHDIPIDEIKRYETDYKWASSVFYCDECAEELEAREI